MKHHELCEQPYFVRWWDHGYELKSLLLIVGWKGTSVSLNIWAVYKWKQLTTSTIICLTYIIYIYIYMFLIESNLLLIIGFECTKHIGMVYMSAQSIILYLCLRAVHAMIPCGTTTCVMYARQHTESLWCRCQGNGQVHTVVQRIPGYSRHFPHNEAKI